MSAIATSAHTYSQTALAQMVQKHNSSGEPTCVVRRIEDPSGEIIIFDSEEGRNAYAQTVGQFADSGEFVVTLPDDNVEGGSETVVVAWGRV